MKVKIIFLITIPFIVLNGCGKIKEARDTVKAVSQTVEAAKDMAKTAESIEESQNDGRLEIELTEESVRRYYRGIMKLEESYPEIEFQSPITAAAQAVVAGENLEKLVEKETDLSYDEYNALSTQIVLALSQSAAAGMGSEMLAAMEDAVAQMEEYDTSSLDDEQKAEFDAQLEEQKAALAEAKSQADSPAMQAQKAQFDMILRVRQELGFE